MIIRTLPFQSWGVLLSLAIMACDPRGGSTTPRERPKAGIRFGRQVTPKGTVCDSMMTEKFYAKLKVHRAGKLSGESLSLTETRIEMKATVHSVGPRFVTAMQVFYRKRHKTEYEPRKKKRRLMVSPVQGRTYLVDARGGKRRVTTVDGKEVTERERKIVLEDDQDVGKPVATFELLPDRPIRKGERIIAPPRAAERAFGLGKKQGMRILRATLTLKGTRLVEGRKTGVFGLKIHARTMAGQSPHMEVWIKGSLQVEIATGWPVRIDVQGPLTIQSRDGEITLKGTGMVKSSGLTICRPKATRGAK